LIWSSTGKGSRNKQHNPTVRHFRSSLAGLANAEGSSSGTGRPLRRLAVSLAVALNFHNDMVYKLVFTRVFFKKNITLMMMMMMIMMMMIVLIIILPRGLHHQYVKSIGLHTLGSARAVHDIQFNCLRLILRVRLVVKTMAQANSHSAS